MVGILSAAAARVNGPERQGLANRVRRVRVASTGTAGESELAGGAHRQAVARAGGDPGLAEIRHFDGFLTIEGLHVGERRVVLRENTAS
jgi:hypothetical protein